MRIILMILLMLPFCSKAQFVKNRLYKKGEKFSYKLTTEVYRNENKTGKTVSISKHEVVADTGYLSEEIQFISKTSFTSKDTVNLDSLATKVLPYKITLSPKGKVLLPKLSVPSMTGDITDLNTFYVAIAPALDVQKLSTKNQIIRLSKLRQGNFADSIEILSGTDCLQITQKLVSVDKSYAVVETSFTPPDSLCVNPILEIIARNNKNQFNNIQFLRKSEGDKVNLLWGREHFTITSKISRINGQILEAKMINTLDLTMRYNCTPDLKSFAAEIPLSIKRILTLELIR